MCRASADKLIWKLFVDLGLGPQGFGSWKARIFHYGLTKAFFETSGFITESWEKS